MRSADADIVLVHGSWHGAWCWRDLIEVLSSKGYRAHAFDLPGLGQDPTPWERVTLSDYAQRTVEFVSSLDRKAWLLGHSMGGGVITQAAEAIADRLHGLIYLAAVCPRDGEGIFQDMGDESALARHVLIDETRGAMALPREHVRQGFYHMCSDAAVERALQLLCAIQPMRPVLEPVRLTPARFGSVPRHFIECLQDRAVPLRAQRQIQCEASFDSVTSLDADHSPFLSCPVALATAIDHIVSTG